MIELIFVIVIIGILAAVAIPKLAATRDDAENTKLISNVTNCVKDYITSYTATGTASKDSDSCKAVLAVTSGKVDDSTSTTEVNVSLPLTNGKTYFQAATYKGSGIVR
jgi:type II secretory pathway pseudopilin PulG